MVNPAICAVLTGFTALREELDGYFLGRLSAVSASHNGKILAMEEIKVITKRQLSVSEQWDLDEATATIIAAALFIVGAVVLAIGYFVLGWK